MPRAVWAIHFGHERISTDSARLGVTEKVIQYRESGTEKVITENVITENVIQRRWHRESATEKVSQSGTEKVAQRKWHREGDTEKVSQRI